MALPKCNRTLAQLNLGFTNVVTVHENERAYNAFKLMAEQNFNGIGVVNSKGVLVGNISATDIKLIGWNSEYWKLMGLPINSYLRELATHPENTVKSYLSTIVKGEIKVLACTPLDTLSCAIKSMCYFNIHRIYIVDENCKPVGVVSTSDIITELLKGSGEESE